MLFRHIMVAVIYACDNSSFRIDLDRLSPERRVLVTDMVEPGKICVSDVENIKGIECDVVFAVTENMNKNEEYIAFTRALSKLYVVG